MWPSRTFLSPSIVRCVPTSLPTNLIYFLIRRIVSGPLVLTRSATDDSKAILLTMRRNEVEWSGLIFLWVVPGFILASPTPVTVLMNGDLMFLDHYSNVKFKHPSLISKFSARSLKAFRYMLRLKILPLRIYSACSAPHSEWGVTRLFVPCFVPAIFGFLPNVFNPVLYFIRDFAIPVPPPPQR